MKKLLSLVLVAALSVSALAQAPQNPAPQPANTVTAQNVVAAGFDKLSESAKLELIKQIEKQASPLAPIANLVPTPEKVDEWSEVGTKVARGLASAAKEAGVAVNEFSKTPVGMITSGIIIWKIMGKDIAQLVVAITSKIYHIIGALCIWIGGSYILLAAFNRAHTTTHYDKEGKLSHSQRDEFGSDATGFYVGIQCVIFVAGIIAFFTAA